MKLWELKWFQSLIEFCRKWQWFNVYIYGKSVNLEDFVRNPGEIMRDTYFPFIIKGITAYSIFNLRCGYIPASYEIKNNVWAVPMGARKFVWKGEKWVFVDLRLFNPWRTKFCNAAFFLQFAVSLWHYIPIPYVSMCIKIVPWYFQFGLGWGPEMENAVLCGKFRFVNEKISNEAILNPTDVLGYYEGTI